MAYSQSIGQTRELSFADDFISLTRLFIRVGMTDVVDSYGTYECKWSHTEYCVTRDTLAMAFYCLEARLPMARLVSSPGTPTVI